MADWEKVVYVERGKHWIARKVKKYMDEKWEPYWHVFLGKSFGCHSVHERNRFVYFTFEPSKISFLIYKAS